MTNPVTIVGTTSRNAFAAPVSVSPAATVGSRGVAGGRAAQPSTPTSSQRLGASTPTTSARGEQTIRTRVAQHKAREAPASQPDISALRASRVARGASPSPLAAAETLFVVTALWDCVPDAADELAFKAGDVLDVLDDSDSEWWFCRRGAFSGNVPVQYVRVL